MKDHEIAKLVNDLRDIAKEFHATQQLRERIAIRVRAALKQEWISTADRLPEDGQTVAFVVSAGPSGRFDYLDGSVLGGTYQAGRYGGFSVPGLLVSASYWMPLPEAPSEGDGGALKVAAR